MLYITAPLFAPIVAYVALVSYNDYCSWRDLERFLID